MNPPVSTLPPNYFLCSSLRQKVVLHLLLQDVLGCNISPVDGFQSKDESLSYLCNVVSKEDGSFSFLSLPSGKYTVVSDWKFIACLFSGLLTFIFYEICCAIATCSPLSCFVFFPFSFLHAAGVGTCSLCTAWSSLCSTNGIQASLIPFILLAIIQSLSVSSCTSKYAVF